MLCFLHICTTFLYFSTQKSHFLCSEAGCHQGCQSLFNSNPTNPSSTVSAGRQIQKNTLIFNVYKSAKYKPVAVYLHWYTITGTKYQLVSRTTSPTHWKITASFSKSEKWKEKEKSYQAVLRWSLWTDTLHNAMLKTACKFFNQRLK